jgi:hypothetical protein
MRFSVQVLAIAATVLSMNAVPQAIERPHAITAAPLASAPSAADDAMAPVRGDVPGGAVWALAVGFLVIVASRRMRS